MSRNGQGVFGRVQEGSSNDFGRIQEGFGKDPGKIQEGNRKNSGRILEESVEDLKDSLGIQESSEKDLHEEFDKFLGRNQAGSEGFN